MLAFLTEVLQSQTTDENLHIRPHSTTQAFKGDNATAHTIVACTKMGGAIVPHL